MNSLSRYSVVLALVLGLVGCGRVTAAGPSDPEELIRLVLEACQEADYQRAAVHFVGGPEFWERSPSFVRDYLDQVSRYGRARSYKVNERLVRGDRVALQIVTYSDLESTSSLTTFDWHFVRKGKGWVVERVE